MGDELSSFKAIWLIEGMFFNQYCDFINTFSALILEQNLLFRIRKRSLKGFGDDSELIRIER